ncbi:benzyl alcohol O-benzoyltransferase-like [Populus alba x Populus x berolinensis]|uniref:Benzyl alcohol O-benzoyltransferase-like n=1 Tax=Populus alba x Populus x berolinensis TaxID=444605 RepID=A0AAD6Q292_9ROSI|nr:benzyl alcohol O-benzoyltransferase-like [Populus alba x Populus x berolinensis]
MASSPSSLVFKVHRREPKLIKPAKPTPHEFKLLSDIDDQEGFRFHIPLILFYRHNPSMQGKDPVKVIREAIAKTLVSRLKCGGFLFALRLNHTMSDGQGLVQFMAAVAEIARGANAPSVPPVWERHVLSATDPPRVTCRHRAYEEVAGSTSSILTQDHLVHRSFFFSPSDITALRRLVPPLLSHCSSFEILTACLWIWSDHCPPTRFTNEEMSIICLVNAREKFNPPLLPRGYYGNGFGLLAAVATAGGTFEKANWICFGAGEEG